MLHSMGVLGKGTMRSPSAVLTDQTLYTLCPTPIPHAILSWDPPSCTFFPQLLYSNVTLKKILSILP